MGLDLHPGRPDPDDESGWSYRGTDPWPQWSYTGFDAFRKRLAAEEGFRLGAMKGFGGKKPWDSVTTALRPLLDHSDCDGQLSPEDAATVAPRLTEVLDKWDAAGGSDPGLRYDVQAGRALVRLLELCAAERIPVMFG